jgi:predicted  nucleic acid-binding Zn-ribbon protein
MRPVEFPPESIIQAGQNLQAAGRNITGFALRQKVGGGSPSRLKQVWDEHLAGQSVMKAESVAELPVEVAEEVAIVSKALTERLAALAIELNDKAVKAAERRVHEVMRSAGDQREQAKRELADAAETVDDLEAKLDEAKAAAEVLEIKLADVQETNHAQAVELAQLRERIAVAEQSARTAGEQHVAELTKAEADQETARKDAATAREAAAKLGGQLEALTTQNAALLSAIKPLGK